MAGIFKAYDIRGVYGESLNAESGRLIGRAYASLIGTGTIVCGRDGRLHSQELQEAFIQGVLESGLDVVDMGLCTTPMNYFACFSQNHAGSAMITASHNPGRYNGLKLCRANAIPIGYDDGLDRIEGLVANPLRPAAKPGRLSRQNYMKPYLDYLMGHVRFRRSFRFAVDTGNGMGGFLLPDLLARLGQQAVPLYWELDFNFPNHEANPLVFDTLRDLCETVRREGLEFGVAFDGDADRCFFVDDRGDIVPADLLTALLAGDVLARYGPGPIVYDIRSSRMVAEQIQAHGGTPVLCRVGHTFMKARMRETGAVFGGELAGHFYFRDFASADSAMLTMITVLNLLAEKQQPLSELIAPLRRYAASGECNFQTDRADQLIQEAAHQFAHGTVSEIDGIRVDFPDWWFCMRRSNTEPLLRLVVEGQTPEILQQGMEALQTRILRGVQAI